MNKNKNLGFTLAEVLIVIGIIGVVAALTLPNLNHATGDKERVTKVKKIYSSLTEAFDRAQAIYGDADTWFNDFGQGTSAQEYTNRFAKRITEFMKISKDCGTTPNAGCFSQSPDKYLNGNPGEILDSANYGPSTSYKVITSDNMSLLFNYYGRNIVVDIDGPNKGENTYGKDIFLFVYNPSISDMIYPNDQFMRYTEGEETISERLFSTGSCAADWIIENDNADYLKADSTGKCNDSDIVLNWTTNTSCH